MKRFALSIGLICAALSACATTARVTIQDRLQTIGLPETQARCLATELDERLDTEDLTDVARYTLTLSQASSPGQALDALLRIDNPRAVAAIGASGISCVLAPLRSRS
ncbi:MAG: hypothetical protein AAF850_10680 [Pseudomonadota bacterium]